MAQPHVVHLLFACAATLSALCSGVGVAYTVSASFVMRRFFSRPIHAPVSFPALTVITPLHGAEWQLLENLTSFVQQDYPGAVQYVLGVHDEGDAALKAVDMLCARFPEKHITVVVDARVYGPNRKVANLANMLDRAEHDLLCFADSDVRVKPSFLRDVVGALQQPGVGLVTCAYRGMCAPGFWPRVSGAMTDYHFLPGVVTGLSIERARPCFGQSIAIMRATLQRIGGLAQFGHHLAEDYAIGEAVRSSGASVVVAPFIVSHACVETTFSQLFAHELRWSRTIRAADRMGHLGAVLMHPFPLALLAVLFSSGNPLACGLVVLTLVVRALLVWQTNRSTGERCNGFPWLPLWDVLQFVIYVASFLSFRVLWRGRHFDVDGDGLMSPCVQRDPGLK
ncbi:bacteriohopanetetrol glucosamine biosynthesis glycosyltransferase HpnI [Caballeronia sp. NK8]|uniref:bacteriohopanetetrol glucosamine biosynthesis glycosyltransferase HpnI n=1 Tax=Caballeronia sp. NK8 TaxID=140098 RepID=UPI001BB6F8E9|nr:bacteriohopanetetrol glucosamine biosynthesis glycosyltransferase HpnI [Caballeronia sp. NK8]BCQ26309.1 bacteriohopanetetrol glucosamine biosynthesis glycosyltransferase HpnI [Caballeronia sp. NK8]